MKRKSDDKVGTTVDAPSGLVASFDPSRRQNMQFFNQLLHGAVEDPPQEVGGDGAKGERDPSSEDVGGADADTGVAIQTTHQPEPDVVAPIVLDALPEEAPYGATQRDVHLDVASTDVSLLPATAEHGVDSRGDWRPATPTSRHRPAGSPDLSSPRATSYDDGVSSEDSDGEQIDGQPSSSRPGYEESADTDRSSEISPRNVRRSTTRKPTRLPALPAERLLPVFLDAAYAPRQVFLRVPAEVRDNLRQLKRVRGNGGEKLSDGAALEMACRLLPSELDVLIEMYISNARVRSRASVAMAPQVRVEVYDWLHEVTDILGQNGVRASVNQLAQLALTLLR